MREEYKIEISTIDGVKIDFPNWFTLENQTQNLLLEFIQKPFLSNEADELADK